MVSVSGLDSVNLPVSVASHDTGNGSATSTSSTSTSTGSSSTGSSSSSSSGGSLVSVQLPGSVNAPISALSSGAGNGSAGLGL